MSARRACPPRLLCNTATRLETLIEAVSERLRARVAGPHRRVLIAPSWGEDALLERHGGAVIAPLLAAGMQVTLRPHPHTAGQHPGLLAEIRFRYARARRVQRGCRYERDAQSGRGRRDGQRLVRRRSGVRLRAPEARAVRRRSAQGQQSGLSDLGIEPLEVWLRERIGTVVPGARSAKSLSTCRHF